MNSLCTRYGIALVVILMQKFAFACIQNATRQGTIPAKTVTNFLKVPWVNVNSLWTSNVASRCKTDVTALFESADAGEMWALQMLDATSRIPSGFLMGNFVDLGAYDECVAVNGNLNSADIQGQHCLVSLSIPSKFISPASAMLHIQKLSIFSPDAGVDLSLTLSVCLPSSCSVEDVVGFVNASIQSIPEFVEFEVSVAQVKCSGVESTDGLTIGTILTISFFVAITGILLSCTICDFVVRTKPENASLVLKTLAKFSVYTNAMNLLSTKISPGTMPAMHGIRFLSTCCTVLVHRGLVMSGSPVVNLSDLYKSKQTALPTVFLTLIYAVDTFFLISAFLATRSFQKTLRSGAKYRVLDFYIHRYIRLTPCLGILLIFVIFILPYLGSGPIWQTCTEDAIDNCRRNWWANLLYVQNFANRGKMCIPHTWYSAVEMQFFLLSPIILYPLFQRPKLGLTMLGIAAIASFITPAVQIVANNYSYLFSGIKLHAESWGDFFNVYPISYNRALPYLVGILLGYDVVSNHRRISKVQAAFNWILTCVFILFCFWNNYFIQPNGNSYDVVSEAVGVSFGRLGWSLAMAWILYACTQGYGGPVTRFLSLPIFVPLSRMSYCIYLVHFVIQVRGEAVTRTAEFYTPFTVIYPVFGDLAISIAVAFVLNVCIETPANILEDIVRAKGPTAAIKKKEKPSAITGEYLDSTKGNKSSSDLVMENRMSQIDFWRTISDLMNTRTSAEWAKAFQEWRNDTQWKSRTQNVQGGATQFKTRIPTLEQELAIFLSSLISGLDGATSFQESSNIVEPERSRDLIRSSTSDATSSTKTTR